MNKIEYVVLNEKRQKVKTYKTRKEAEDHVKQIKSYARNWNIKVIVNGKVY